MHYKEGFSLLERTAEPDHPLAPECLHCAVREEHAMLQAAQWLARLASWSLDPATGAILWSAEAHRIFGLSAPELQGLGVPQFLERVHPEDREQLAALIEDACSRRLSAAFGYRFLGMDGRYRQIRGEGESQSDAQGRVVRLVGVVTDATTQNRLVRDADRLHVLERVTAVWLWEQDASFRFTMYTGGLSAIKGAGDCIGKTRWELGTPLEGTWDDHRRDLAAHRPLRDFEYRIGSQVVSVTGVPVYAPDGAFVGYRGTSLNVTAVKKLEDEAGQAHGLMRLAARLARVGAWSLDVPSFTLIRSDELERICGGRRPTFTEAMASVHEPWRRRLRDAIDACATQGAPFEFEVRADRGNGRSMWLRVAGEAQRGPDGEIRRINGMAQDISEPRAAREALQASEERHRLLFESSPDAILEKSEDGTIRRANPAACAMFGLRQERLVGLNSYDLVDDPRVREQVARRRRTGTSRGELTLVRPDGSRFIAEVHSAAYTSSEGAPLINVIARDVSERTRLREELEEMNQRLADLVAERTADLEAANAELKGFARSLAHDLRQPIAGAKALSIAVRAALANGQVAKARTLAEQVTAAADLMDEYVNALLSLARISQATLDHDDVDLTAIALGLAEELKRQEPPRRVQFSIEPGLGACGDATLLRLLLQNLLGNAFKFTSRHEAGRISLSATTDEWGRTVYCVRDNGAGFDAGQAYRLFGNFSRLHRQSDFPGTGIGLANAKRIVERHGGAIWAESSVGEGASFMFTLARVPGAEDSGMGALRPTQPGSLAALQ